MSRTAKIVLVIALIILIGAGLVFWQFWPEKDNLSPTATASKTGLFGTMLAFNINDAASGIPGKSDALQNGWTEFKKDNLVYESLKSNLEKIIQDHTKLVKTTGFAIDRELVPYFTWNVIEPQKGQFDWELTDIYVKGASNAGVKISAVIQPFASWDQKNTQVNSNCKALDFAYYDYKVGPPNDLAEYENFLTKTVERYKDNVAVWEIGNEYDGPCGGYQDNPQGYFDLLKTSSGVIKKADPTAKVTNGGASEVAGAGPGTDSTKNFWTKFFTLGGGQYIDYFNFHYNTERSQSAKLDSTTFQEALTFLNDLMDKSAQGGGGRKPLYLTEFGIYSGAPSQPASIAAGPAQEQSPVTNQPVSPPTSTGQGPNGSQTGQASSPSSASRNLPNESQESQATLYFKDSMIAFANGADFVFIDLIGSGNDVVGSSMAFNTDGQPRPFLTTLKTITSEVSGFSKVEKIAEGQYKFTVGGKTVYALWSGTLPSKISGKVRVTDIKGQEQTMDAAEIKLSADQPILIELQK